MPSTPELERGQIEAARRDRGRPGQGGGGRGAGGESRQTARASGERAVSDEGGAPGARPHSARCRRPSHGLRPLRQRMSQQQVDDEATALLDHHEDCAVGHGVAGLDPEVDDLAVLGGLDLVLHLHRLETQAARPP